MIIIVNVASIFVTASISIINDVSPTTNISTICDVPVIKDVSLTCDFYIIDAIRISKLNDISTIHYTKIIIDS